MGTPLQPRDWNPARPGWHPSPGQSRFPRQRSAGGSFRPQATHYRTGSGKRVALKSPLPATWDATTRFSPVGSRSLRRQQFVGGLLFGVARGKSARGLPAPTQQFLHDQLTGIARDRIDFDYAWHSGAWKKGAMRGFDHAVGQAGHYHGTGNFLKRKGHYLQGPGGRFVGSK